MTEAKWLSATDPRVMLNQLSGTVSSRKARLLKVATARLRWEEFAHTVLRETVELAESFADGNTSEAVFGELRGRVYGYFDDNHPLRRLPMPPLHLLSLALATGYNEQMNSQLAGGANWMSSVQLLSAELPPILRCIFGNPFRPVAFAPEWRTETAVALAAGIYDERAFDRLPILADALEEAGCDHPDVLRHCRGPGPHARGCWVVDGVLGKQ
jgi:hypothetical protein